MSDRHNEPVNILLVEDDSIDVKAFQRAMGKLKISNPVAVARDGVEGWEYLQKCVADGGGDDAARGAHRVDAEAHLLDVATCR